MKKSFFFLVFSFVVILFVDLLLEIHLHLELVILFWSSIDFSLKFLLDNSSAMFIITVTFIFSMIYLYSFSYMSSEVYFKRFMLILTLFVFSMLILIMSGNLFTTLIGWDGLGLTSLFLILFYYSSASFVAGTITFLMNRVGDCFFIMMFVNVILMSIPITSPSVLYCTSILILITSITKSAQIPFSMWLPAAMEAPTPVSSLVHSSTLVTAGIFLLYRYDQLWIQDFMVKKLIMVLSLSTCLMASLAALVESDLKKLIAFSTLSQLGFIMFAISLGLLRQGFFHMLMHAFFKALLFMTAGLLIHSFKGTQNIQLMSLNKAQSPILVTVMCISFLSMMGLPFLSGFYSKDFILDSLQMSEYSILLWLSVLITFVLTVLYSIRVIWYLLNSTSNWNSMSDSDLGMIKPMIPLLLMASLSGSSWSWMFLDLDLTLDNSKIGILLMILISLILFWASTLLNLTFMNDFLEKKWYLSSFNKILSSFYFTSVNEYSKSSDLLGIPEFVSKSVYKRISNLGEFISETIMVYTGHLEFFLFLMFILVLN